MCLLLLLLQQHIMMQFMMLHQGGLRARGIPLTGNRQQSYSYIYREPPAILKMATALST